jgi:hypothetical protein
VSTEKYLPQWPQRQRPPRQEEEGNLSDKVSFYLLKLHNHANKREKGSYSATA